VDSQTRHALKQDKFVQATTTGLSWIEIHRDQVIRLSIAAVVLLATIIGGTMYYEHRTTQASAALGQALEIYNSPLHQAGEPEDGTYKTIADRSKAANQQFSAVASQYGSLEPGKIARYFVGLTDIDLGRLPEAESNLKEISGSYNKNLSSLAKVALAGLYVQEGKTQPAIGLYKEIIAKPSAVVPASAAQLQLAEVYEKTDPQQAKQIYAVLKDKDKTAAGQIATQKLNPTQTPGPPIQ
jgi:predicted negative regulator of RcsB-dependent stress response